MNMHKFLLFIFSTLICLSVHGQKKSFLVQLKPNDKIKSHHVNQRSLDKNTIVQKCDYPLNIWVVEGNDIDEVKNQLSIENEILYISENRKVTLRKTPNDDFYTMQWQYANYGTNSNGVIGADIKAEQAWDITTGGKTVNGDDIVVAIIDDGFDTDHEDIIENLWENNLEIKNDGIDNDTNGYIDDINGWNIDNNNGNINNNRSHGTQVTGIVGARGNNEIGVTGVNWNVKMMMVTYGNATEADVIAAYSYPYKMRKLYNESNGQQGAFVVATNSSWGQDNGDPNESVLWCAMYDSLGSVGILSAGATSNSNVNVDNVGDLPSACESEFLIAVTNLTSNNLKTSAGFGKKSIDLGAYGAGVHTIALNNSYSSFGGTSAATPHVAGAIALLYSINCDKIGEYYKKDPAGIALYIKDIILSNTTPNNSLKNITTTEGALNLGKATHAMNKFCEDCIPLGGLKTETFLDSKSAKISWYETKNPLINIRFRKFNESIWIDTLIALPASTKSPSAVLENLDYCTEYVYQTQYKCADTISEWGYNKYFKSRGCCEAPEEIAITSKDSIATIENKNKQNIFIEVKNSFDDHVDSIFTSDSLYTLKVSGFCKQYYIGLSRYCPIQNRFSPISKPYLLNTDCYSCTDRDYCSFNKLDNISEWIEAVTINGKTNISGKDKLAYGTYFGAIIPELELGDTVYAELTPGYSNSSFGEKFNVFIDWNQDQDFSADERIIFNTNGANSTYTDKAPVPLTAKLGYTRMRITMTFNGNGDPCKTSAEYGELEDYCVLINPMTNIAEPLLEKNFVIIPNPNKGNFMIKSSDIIEEINVYNSMGELIHSQTGGSKEENLSLQLTKGMYHLLVKTQYKNQTQKFVIVE